MNLNDYAKVCREANDKWWRDPLTGELIFRNKGELMMLMVTEIAEMCEGERKALMDEHLPHRRMAHVEAADLLIRLFDYAGEWIPELEEIFWEKMEYNRTRLDHTPSARLQPGGKKW